MMVLFMAELQLGKVLRGSERRLIGETAPAIPNRDFLLMQLNSKRCSQFSRRENGERIRSDHAKIALRPNHGKVQTALMVAQPQSSGDIRSNAPKSVRSMGRIARFLRLRSNRTDLCTRTSRDTRRAPKPSPFRWQS